MNLAQVIDFDYETRTPRISLEKARCDQPLPPRNQAAAAGEPVVREHRAPTGDGRRHESCVRRALRKGGREVMATLRAGADFLSFSQIRSALPHVSERTLHVRLSIMVSRGDVVRSGEFRDYRYSAQSTEAST